MPSQDKGKNGMAVKQEISHTYKCQKYPESIYLYLFINMYECASIWLCECSVI